MISVGLISGTSADGIEAAVVSLDGAPPKLNWKLLAHINVPFSTNLRDRIFKSFRPESSTVDFLCRLNHEIGEAFANATLDAIQAARLKPSDVGVIGSHGQTVWHDPPTADSSGATLQIGSAAVIAERTGITTVSNVRARDVAAGGHGAPIVSFLDWILFRHTTRTRAIQNIGGIGNVTYLPPLSSSGEPLAFDTGPGNMLIDFLVSKLTGGRLEFDRNGEIAARGHVREDLVKDLMKHPYFRLQPPKTTGRELFGAQYGAQFLERATAMSLSDEDMIATATAFTAQSIAQSYHDFLPERVDEIFLAGGGALNPKLVEMIQARVVPTPVYPHDVLGLEPSAKEAVTLAVLAYETIHGRTSNLPSCTGARHACLMGDITPGRGYYDLH